MKFDVGLLEDIIHLQLALCGIPAFGGGYFDPAGLGFQSCRWQRVTGRADAFCCGCFHRFRWGHEQWSHPVVAVCGGAVADGAGGS